MLSTVLCKHNATQFRRYSRLFWAFRRKNIDFSDEAKFRRIVMIIRGPSLFQLREVSNDNLLCLKIDFDK